MSKPSTTQVNPTPLISGQQSDVLAQQAAVLQQYRNMLGQQFAAQNTIAPFLYQSLGLTPTTQGIFQAPDVAQQQGQQVQLGLQQRALDALAGRLPVDAQTRQALGQQQRDLAARYQAQLGPGYQLGSPYIQAQALQNQYAANVIDTAARNDLNTAVGLGLAQTQAQQQAKRDYLANIAGALGIQYAGSGQLANIAQGLQGPSNTLGQATGLGVQSQLYGQGLQGAQTGQLIGAVGNIAGALGGVGLASMLRTPTPPATPTPAAAAGLGGATPSTGGFDFSLPNTSLNLSTPLGDTSGGGFMLDPSSFSLSGAGFARGGEVRHPPALFRLGIPLRRPSTLRSLALAGGR